MDFKNNFQINPDAFSGVVVAIGELGPQTRYMKPPKISDIPESRLKYSSAAKLANDLELFAGCRYFVIVNGSFYYGDFIEALIVEKNLKIKELTISTLSLSQNNIDSLAGLLQTGHVDKLNLIISDYFYSAEQKGEGLIPYLYEKLDIDGNRFQCAVAGIHCKTCVMETQGGHHLVMHGSANLRSSANLEQIAIEESGDTYNFIMEYSRAILAKFATINHNESGRKLVALRYTKLWEAVNF